MIDLLLNTLVALCLLIGLGFAAGRWLGVNLHSMAMISIYIIAPVVNFGAVARLKLDPAYLLVPLALFGLAAIIAWLAHQAGKLVFADDTANLVAMAGATGNTGYFGVPLAMAVLGPEVLGIYLLMNFGMNMAETTIGFYFGARGRFGIGEALKKVAYLPTIYAVSVGLLWNVVGLPLPGAFTVWWDRFTGAWIVVGMMIIGVALGQVRTYQVNARLLAFLFTVKFVVWPLGTVGLALLDRHVFGLFGGTVHILLLVIGIVPLAGNTVAFAARLDMRPGEVALAVLLSTLFAIVYVPVVFGLFGISPR